MPVTRLLLVVPTCAALLLSGSAAPEPRTPGTLWLGTTPAVAAASAAAVRHPCGSSVTRVSVSSTGRQASRGSGLQQTVPAMSSDGRFVAFVSLAADLVPGDTNGAEDVFVRDRRRGVTRRVSVGPRGRQADNGSVDPAISGDGRLVAFTSAATNLVRHDSNGVKDVFVHDLRTGRTRRVSVGPGGRQGDADSFFPALSADGSTVAFQTSASNLLPRRALRDTNGVEDVYARDLRRGRTTRVSLGRGGRQLPGPSAQPAVSAGGRWVAFVAEYRAPNHFEVWLRDRRTHRTRLVSVRRPVTEDNSVGRPSISGDGRRVAFASSRTTLVPGDTDDARDVYVRDLRTGRFTRVSLTAGGAQPDADSDAPALSPDGRYVAFASHASNLVPGDTNERSDVFVTRLGSGTLRRVSVADDGAQGDDHSAFFAELSVADRGRHVVFESSATTLVPGDTNRRPDVFVWDRHRCGRAR